MEPMELARQLADVSLFQGMSPEQIATIVGGAERQHYAAGEVICREGDPVDGFYILLEGRVSVRKAQGEREAEVAVLSPKAVFGEMGLIGGKPRSASCVPAEPCVIYRIDRAAFEELCARGGAATVRLVLNLAAIIAARLESLTAAFAELTERVEHARKPEDKVHELDVFRDKLYTEWAF